MSLSSIMSGADPDPPASTPYPLHAMQQSRRSSKTSVTNSLQVKQEVVASPAPPDLPMNDNITVLQRPFERTIINGDIHPTPSHIPRDIPVPDESAVEAEIARIETMDLSDVEGPEFEEERQEYIKRCKKRSLEVETAESVKRKVRSGYPLAPSHVQD